VIDQQASVGTSKGQSSTALNVLFAAWPLGLLALFICGSAGVLSVAMGPDNNWDLRYYHLYAPWAYLHDRYLYDVGPAQVQGFFNPTADLLFYALMSSRLNETPRIIAFIMGAVHGINAALVLGIAYHIFRPLQLLERSILTALALLMGVSGAGFIPLLGTTTNDLVDSIFVLSSLLAILQLDESKKKRWMWSRFAGAGVLAGFAIGLKYTAVIFIPGLTLVALVTALRHQAIAGLIAFIVATILGFLLVAGHHLLTLWRDFGNPVFPLLNHIFHSPFYEPRSIRDTRFVFHDVWQLIAYPFYWTKTNSYLVSELAFRDWRGAIAYVAMATASIRCAADRLLGERRRYGVLAEKSGLDLILIFVAISYLCWCVGFGIYRYAVVLEMLTGVVSIGGLIWLFEDSAVRIAVAIAAFTTVATTTVYPDWGRGEHPSAGIRPARYGAKYIDVRVPQLPMNSLVLIPTWEPVSYFIPFAEPTARYLGIENNFLQLSQNNKLVAEVRRLMRTPGAPKFILSVGAVDSDNLNRLLGEFGLRLRTSPCERISSNLEEHALSLCQIAVD
jgi:hypothetical protein